MTVLVIFTGVTLAYNITTFHSRSFYLALPYPHFLPDRFSTITWTMYIFSFSGIFILFLIYYLRSPLACLAVVSRSAFLPLGLEKLRITGQTYDPGLCFCYHSRHFPSSFYCFSTHQQPHLPTNTLRRCQRPIIEDTHSSACVCQLFGDQLQI